MADRRRRGALWKQTRGEQDSYRNTLNLFFGALLGANLGTLGDIAVQDYVFIIATLLGAIMALQLVSNARSRTYAVGMLGLYALILAMSYLEGDLRPRGVSEGDFNKILATLGVWLSAILIIELTPVLDDDPPA